MSERESQVKGVGRGSCRCVRGLSLELTWAPVESGWIGSRERFFACDEMQIGDMRVERMQKWGMGEVVKRKFITRYLDL